MAVKVLAFYECMELWRNGGIGSYRNIAITKGIIKDEFSEISEEDF